MNKKSVVLYGDENYAKFISYSQNVNIIAKSSGGGGALTPYHFLMF
jgi:hypothetical protein